MFWKSTSDRDSQKTGGKPLLHSWAVRGEMAQCDVAAGSEVVLTYMPRHSPGCQHLTAHLLQTGTLSFILRILVSVVANWSSLNIWCWPDYWTDEVWCCCSCSPKDDCWFHENWGKKVPTFLIWEMLFWMSQELIKQQKKMTRDLRKKRHVQPCRMERTREEIRHIRKLIAVWSQRCLVTHHDWQWRSDLIRSSMSSSEIKNNTQKNNM